MQFKNQSFNFRLRSITKKPQCWDRAHFKEHWGSWRIKLTDSLEFSHLVSMFPYRTHRRRRPLLNIQGTSIKQSTRGLRDKNWESVRWGELPSGVLFGARLCVHKCGTFGRWGPRMWIKQSHRWKHVAFSLDRKTTLYILWRWGITVLFILPSGTNCWSIYRKFMDCAGDAVKYIGQILSAFGLSII